MSSCSRSAHHGCRLSGCSQLTRRERDNADLGSPLRSTEHDSLTLTVNESEILYGSFTTALVIFLLTAVAVFLFIVKPHSGFAERRARDQEPDAPDPTEIELLTPRSMTAWHHEARSLRSKLTLSGVRWDGLFEKEEVMSTGNRGRRITVLLGVAALLASLLAGPAIARNENGDGAARSQEVQLQILAINDFHGNINTFSSSFGGSGGAQNLATNIRAREAEVRNSIVVSAGDLIGASPLISALFHDEPTIEAMNLIGLDINGVGNHEFDEGPAELLRMANGGSHPVDGDLDGDPFLGSDFDFLAANVVVDATGNTLFPPYTVRNYQGIRVAFIGLTLEGTPTIVTPSGVEGLTFKDEAETINSIVSHLQRRNIESFVILLHEGGFSDGGQNDCGTGLTGPIADITRQLDDAVDLVIAGHTNDEFICEIDGKWVTMADNAGRIFTDIDVTLNRVTKDLTVQNIENVNNLQSAEDAPDLVELIEKYDTLSAPLANAVIGTITDDILRANNAAGESALGDVIADAQLDATDDPGFGDAVVAFMNPGGIRDDLDFAPEAGAPDGPGEVTYGEAFSVQPFGNSLVTMTLTGTQIDMLLEQQFDNPGPGSMRVLQVSNGFTYTWDMSAAAGAKVDIGSIAINGVPIDPNAEYRVTVNSFLADGGDNFAILTQGTNRLGGEVDLDALVTYFENNSPVAPGPQNRISTTP